MPDFLEQMISTSHAEILDTEFHRYFLGYFTNSLVPEDAEKVKVNWIRHVAGSVLIPVDIINQYAEVIATVPSLHDTSAIQYNRNAQEYSILEICDMYTMESGHIPRVANENFNQRMGKHSPDVDMDGVTEQWLKIFKHFNIPLPSENGTIQTEEKPQPAPSASSSLLG